MRRLKTNLLLHHLALWAAEITPVAVILLLNVSVAYGFAELGLRSITIGNDSPSAVTTYNLDLNTTEGETLGSIEVEFCSNSPLIGDSCSVPAGIDVSGAVLDSQTGPGNFSISGLSNSYTLILTRPASVVVAQDMTFDFSNITNPSGSGTFYARLQTFASTDATGSPNDVGGVAMAITPSVNVSTYVPPYLYFCVGAAISGYYCTSNGGSYLNFGDLSTAATSSSISQMVVATNAPSGYSIQVTGDSMTSGNNVIPPLASSGSAVPGEDQFGLNLVANNKPPVGADEQGPGSGTPTVPYAQPNIFKYTNGDVVASSTEASDFKEFTISYIIDINASQPPGYYATTLTYIGMGNF